MVIGVIVTRQTIGWLGYLEKRRREAEDSVLR